MERSPLAPDTLPELHPVDGFRLAVAESGTVYKNRPDLMLLLADDTAAAAGVLTRSKTASAAVDWCRSGLENGAARAVFANAGNANAFTGRLGVETVEATAAALGARIGAAPEDILLASTGVIGEPLEGEPMVKHLPGMVERLSETGWAEAAEAIRTTDTFAKAASRKLALSGKGGGREAVITGIAKGSGMIAPDMATMLAFIATDAAIEPGCLQAVTAAAADRSFNAITVDGDTSTSDTLLVLASGRAGNASISDAASGDGRAFAEALAGVMTDLAKLVVRDGEGASKFITVTVAGAEDDRAARRIGMSIANSPLVKTAVAGCDANWGRVVMAVGKSGEKADRDRLGIAIGGVEIAREGRRVEGYDESSVEPHMKGREIDIAVDVGVGAGEATVWTCDLTHGYITINADYRS